MAKTKNKEKNGNKRFFLIVILPFILIITALTLLFVKAWTPTFNHEAILRTPLEAFIIPLETDFGVSYKYPKSFTHTKTNVDLNPYGFREEYKITHKSNTAISCSIVYTNASKIRELPVPTGLNWKYSERKETLDGWAPQIPKVYSVWEMKLGERKYIEITTETRNKKLCDKLLQTAKIN